MYILFRVVVLFTYVIRVYHTGMAGIVLKYPWTQRAAQVKHG